MKTPQPRTVSWFDLTDRKEIAFAPAAPETARAGIGAGERGGLAGACPKSSTTASP